MEDDGSAQAQAVWPLPKFSFRVEWDGAEMMFAEVSGLEAEAQPVEFRHGDSKLFGSTKMPGIEKFRNVTLKKGILKADSQFRSWRDEIRIKRGPMTISLLDEKGSAMNVWALADAWPVKITISDLKAESDEVAVEAMEFGYEGVTVVDF